VKALAGYADRAKNFAPSSLQSKAHDNLNIGDNGFRSAHGGLDPPGLQCLQRSIVHRARRGADQPDVTHRTICQDSHRDGAVAH
jgi:hypothetical protein